MVISAYDVTTEARGFNPCRWPANTLAAARELARQLSIRMENDQRYPNAFWVSDGTRTIGKFFRGEFFAAGTTI